MRIYRLTRRYETSSCYRCLEKKFHLESFEIFKLWASIDHGRVWVPIHQNVKAFFWSPQRVLYVERTEFNGMGNTVLKSDLRNWTWYLRPNNTLQARLAIRKQFTTVIENVEDFQIRGDYMFATRKNSKVNIISDVICNWMNCIYVGNIYKLN